MNIGTNAARGVASYVAAELAGVALAQVGIGTSGILGVLGKALPAGAGWYGASRLLGAKASLGESALAGGISFFAGATASNIAGRAGALGYAVKGAGAVGGALLAGAILR